MNDQGMEGITVFSASVSSGSLTFFLLARRFVELNPKVTEDGDIVYIFPELQVTY